MVARWPLTMVMAVGLIGACGDMPSQVDGDALVCPSCASDEICVFKCDGDGAGGFIGCEPNPEQCEAGEPICSAECERSLCGVTDAGLAFYSCQTGTYCPEVPGAFYCQGP